MCLCVKLSRIKDKEDYTSSVEDYEDGTSVVGGSQPVQYAVSNPNTLGTPHTASTSNLADLAIVMGSQARQPGLCVVPFNVMCLGRGGGRTHLVVALVV